MCQPNFDLRFKTIRCNSCKGTGIAMMNDFSDPYQVTQYEENCMHCVDGFQTVAEKVIQKCTYCQNMEEVNEFYPIEWISEEDKICIKNNGYIERVCDTCNEPILEKEHNSESNCMVCLYGAPGKHNHETFEDLYPPRETGFERNY